MSPPIDLVERGSRTPNCLKQCVRAHTWLTHNHHNIPIKPCKCCRNVTSGPTLHELQGITRNELCNFHVSLPPKVICSIKHHRASAMSRINSQLQGTSLCTGTLGDGQWGNFGFSTRFDFFVALALGTPLMNAWTPFSEEALFFTDSCFVAILIPQTSFRVKSSAGCMQTDAGGALGNDSDLPKNSSQGNSLHGFLAISSQSSLLARRSPSPGSSWPSLPTSLFHSLASLPCFPSPIAFLIRAVFRGHAHWNIHFLLFSNLSLYIYIYKNSHPRAAGTVHVCVCIYIQPQSVCPNSSKFHFYSNFVVKNVGPENPS